MLSKDLDIQLQSYDISFNTASGKYYCNAMVIATVMVVVMFGFNTASGKYYCNQKLTPNSNIISCVSIPQAVSTIAIAMEATKTNVGSYATFQYRKR